MTRTARIKLVLSLFMAGIFSVIAFFVMSVRRAEIENIPRAYNERMENTIGAHIEKFQQRAKTPPTHEQHLRDLRRYMGKLKSIEGVHAWERADRVWLDLPTGAQYYLARKEGDAWIWAMTRHEEGGWTPDPTLDKEILPDSPSAETAPKQGAS